MPGRADRCTQCPLQCSAAISRLPRLPRRKKCLLKKNWSALGSGTSSWCFSQSISSSLTDLTNLWFARKQKSKNKPVVTASEFSLINHCFCLQSDVWHNSTELQALRNCAWFSLLDMDEAFQTNRCKSHSWICACPSLREAGGDPGPPHLSPSPSSNPGSNGALYAHPAHLAQGARAALRRWAGSLQVLFLLAQLLGTPHTSLQPQYLALASLRYLQHSTLSGNRKFHNKEKRKNSSGYATSVTCSSRNFERSFCISKLPLLSRQSAVILFLFCFFFSKSLLISCENGVRVNLGCFYKQ